MGKKVFVLVSDGVSIRNFTYTSFPILAKEKNIELVFWNSTPFNMQNMDVKEVKINNPKPSAFTDLIKTALIRTELNLFSNRDNDSIYQEYKFPLSFKNLKSSLKSIAIKLIMELFNSENGIRKLRSTMLRLERKTAYYKHCKLVLEKEKPDFLFSTSQRAVTGISPLTAAQDLGVLTGAFIYSWDNVPKATTVLTADYYFVWSDYMKNELLHYQKYISPDQIKVTGTPQFENHFKASLNISRSEFFDAHGLDSSKKYICFSGDDITTSPKDELYLRDLAKAVKNLNSKTHHIGIIFRRCPVDFSNRYDSILEAYEDIIVSVNPIWKKEGGVWNSIMPTKEDYKLQTNIIEHTECVVNLGSSMVFDYAAYNKPCAFMNYNYFNPEEQPEKGVNVYDFVHFRSKPSIDAVCWLNHPDEISMDLENLLTDSTKTVKASQDWFNIINYFPPSQASNRILSTINKLISTN
ncbi:MAG: UDP-glycosyltransferase [Algibacter sp.]|uniref:UDP-glycosyltransferase n=1 Tax=Algibacter sp. TaxID=1872428 RepID=UPI0026250BBF|nr:UDP-glycosyltransferase [Algibacter sp.]MDG1729352.1 UDP-glycosyltransferase [Algibacter sp.]MDG2177323.1 UDP-glycosyltransferase [Algibacter sp.]